jgi:DNA-binding response OmpR family regulator
MNLLIVENNFLLKENFFFQSDLEDNINLIFSSSIRSVKKILNKKKFDFIIISSLAPKLNSFDVITNIFKIKPKNKIIQILEKNNDTKHSFSSYHLKKPFMVNKLLFILSKSKIKKLNKKKIINLKNGLIFKKFQRKLFFLKKKIGLTLTEKESEILEYLLKEKKFIKKKVLLENIWGFNSKVKTRTLETHIYRLRKKIRKNFGIKKFISVKDNSYKIF